MPDTSISIHLRRGARLYPRGATTIWTLFAIVLMVMLTAVVLDVRLAAYGHQKIQTACDSCALAAAAALMEAGPTPPSWHTGNMPDSDCHAPQLSIARQLRAAREQASHYAARNRMFEKPAALAANAESFGDLSVGWIESQEIGYVEMKSPNAAGRVNSVSIRAGRSHYRGHPVTRALGVAGITEYAESIATVDQQLYGFRPTGHVPAPLIPLVVMNTKPGLSPSVHAQVKSRDRFSVNPRSGEIQRGSDGIPELTLTVGQPAGSETRLFAHPFSVATTAGYETLLGQIQDGLTDADLAELGGNFSLLRDGRLHVAGLKAPNAEQLTRLQSALLAVRGEKRVWPLGKRRSSRAGHCWIVSGFAAGQILECRLVANEKLVVTVQPCWLQTCTALVRDGERRNPWIGKLQLTL